MRHNKGIDLPGFGHFCGCSYCISELDAAIELEKQGFELLKPGEATDSMHIGKYGEPRPVPPEWIEALEKALENKTANQPLEG